MKKSTFELTVILPCAGSGSRLGLDTPKELFEILPGIRLIDFSLSHIQAAPPGLAIKIAVVIRTWKQAVADYVQEKLPGRPVQAVLFDDRFDDWPGSVYSARETFSPANLVLLPDSLLDLAGRKSGIMPRCFDEKGLSLLELVFTNLEKKKSLFGWVPCSDATILKDLGALRVEQGEVTAFQDKPKKDFQLYNGFWGCYAFREEVSRALYEFLIHSVRQTPLPLEEQPFSPPGAIPLAAYRDFGTWPAIRPFQAQVSSRISP